ncbi:hypothetical protein [Alteribacter populi]|uniref:hypothetical protein n=1 Tax=Alteribacter populi TaxID=2011011 RepID=UPI000BBB54D8|nr:hypothetical protein [Alteribacter populi]
MKHPLSNNLTRVRVKEKAVHYFYHYKNRQKDTLRTWVALPPPETSTQGNIRIDSAVHPDQESHHLGQTLYYYELAPGDEIELSIYVDLYRVSLESYEGEREQPVPLSSEEKAFYLRSEPLSPVTEELRKEALAIADKNTLPLEQAWQLFTHLYKTYKYQYPPKKRGALYFKEKK